MLKPEDELTVLEQTRALIDRGWCQIDYAQDEEENPLYVYSPPEPTYWSLAGALWDTAQRARIGQDYPILAGKLRAFLSDPRQELEDFNDLPTTTKQDVIALLDRVIADVKARTNR